MSKVKGFAPKVTPELLANVEAVLAMADKSRYSATKVYAAYNAVTGKNDSPQTCASCLRNRVKALREWHRMYWQGVDEVRTKGGSYTLTKDNSFQVSTPDGDTAPPSADERPDAETPAVDNETPDVSNNGAPIDVIRLHSPSLEKPLYFQPGDDPMKGKVQYEGGGAIKPGKYELSDGRELAVQPGGKATLKEAPAENDLL